MITNLSKNTVLAQHIMIADSFWRRLKGLLGTQSLLIESGLIIRPCSSVHTFGMRYVIDVLFMNRNHGVCKAVSSMAPGKVAWCSAAFYVIELPEGTIEKTKTTIGDKIGGQALRCMRFSKDINH